jgi:hypothetical protein
VTPEPAPVAAESAAARPDRRAAWIAFLLPLLVYNLGHRYLGSGDTVPAELLPISVLTEGNLDFNEFESSPTPPYYFQWVGPRLVSRYPIVPGLLNVPVYAAARIAGIDLMKWRYRLSRYTSTLLTSFSVLFLYRALRLRYGSTNRALGFSLAYAFGTGVATIGGHALFQHGPALFFLTGALALILGARPWTVALAGPCLALAVLTRPTNVFLAAPLAFVVARRRARWLPAFGALAAVPVLLHALYCWRYLGTPWSTGQSVPAGNFSGDAWQGLAGLLVSPSRGLLVFSPFLVFAIPAAVAAFRRSDEDRLLERGLVIGSVAVLALYARWVLWWGGHSFGYRLITELALPLIVLVAFDWPRIRASRPAVVIFSAALAWSVLVQGLGGWMFPSHFNARVDQEQWTLWSLRDSELPLLVEKLLGHTRGRTSLERNRAGLSRDLFESPGPAPHAPPGTREDPSIPLSVDAPRADQVVRGTLTVHGWAQPHPDDPGEVWILIAPGGIERRADRFARLDAARAFPVIGDGHTAGFGARFEPPLPRLRRYTLVVEVRSRDGTLRRSNPVTFLWGPGPRSG